MIHRILSIMLTLTLAALQANAQEKMVAKTKWYDNCYVGINGGGAVPTTHHTWKNDVTPNFGLRIGKNMNTVVGFAVEANGYFETACAGKGPDFHSREFIENINVNFLASFNLSNLFLRYKGEPRLIELIMLGGYGWGHGIDMGHGKNLVSSKVALDIALNLGARKEWQIYVEPSINYGLQGYNGYSTADKFKYNINKSNFQLNAGIIYKLPNSDGSRNFRLISLRDDNELKNLNNRILALRQEMKNAEEKHRKELEKKDGEIALLYETLDDCRKKMSRNETHREDDCLQTVIKFKPHSTKVDDSQMDELAVVANYLKSNPTAKLIVKGYTAEEKESSSLIAENRAFSVLTTLVRQYQVSIDRLETQAGGYDRIKGDAVVFEKSVK